MTRSLRLILLGLAALLLLVWLYERRRTRETQLQAWPTHAFEPAVTRWWHP